MRSLMSCLLKSFGIVLLYYACILFVHQLIMASAISALLGEKSSAVQIAAQFSEPIAACFFGIALILLATPISRAMVNSEERVEVGGLATIDFLLVGICIASLCFIFKTLPSLIQQMLLLPGAKNIQMQLSRLASDFLQLCVVAIVLIKRHKIAQCFAKPQ